VTGNSTEGTRRFARGTAFLILMTLHDFIRKLSPLPSHDKEQVFSFFSLM